MALISVVRLLSSDLPCVALICISDGSARRELVCAHRRLLTQTSLVRRASGGGMRRSEEARVSEEAVKRKGGGAGPRELGTSRG